MGARGHKKIVFSLEGAPPPAADTAPLPQGGGGRRGDAGGRDLRQELDARRGRQGQEGQRGSGGGGQQPQHKRQKHQEGGGRQERQDKDRRGGGGAAQVGGCCVVCTGVVCTGVICTGVICTGVSCTVAAWQWRCSACLVVGGGDGDVLLALLLLCSAHAPGVPALPCAVARPRTAFIPAHTMWCLLPGWLAPWLPGSLAPWLPGSLAPWLPGSLARERQHAHACMHHLWCLVLHPAPADTLLCATRRPAMVAAEASGRSEAGAGGSRPPPAPLLQLLQQPVTGGLRPAACGLPWGRTCSSPAAGCCVQSRRVHLWQTVLAAREPWICPVWCMGPPHVC